MNLLLSLAAGLVMRFYIDAYYEEQRIASTAGVCTLCDFRLGKQGTEVPTLHTCHYVKNILGKQCTCGHTSCFMQISALLTFCKILLGNIPNPLTIFSKSATLLRS